jgi:hypothetical protein
MCPYLKLPITFSDNIQLIKYSNLSLNKQSLSPKNKWGFRSVLMHSDNVFETSPIDQNPMKPINSLLFVFLL